MIHTGSNTGNPAGKTTVKKATAGSYTRETFIGDLSKVAKKTGSGKK